MTIVPAVYLCTSLSDCYTSPDLCDVAGTEDWLCETTFNQSRAALCLCVDQKQKVKDGKVHLYITLTGLMTLYGHAGCYGESTCDPPVTVTTHTQGRQMPSCCREMPGKMRLWNVNVLEDKAHAFFMVNTAASLLWYDNERLSSRVLSYACDNRHKCTPHLARWNRFSSALQET